MFFTSDKLFSRKNLHIAKVIIHEGYDKKMQINDIALLQLREPVDLSVYMPACLPAKDKDWTGQTGWVYGWGTLREGGSSSTLLRETTQEVVDRARCEEALQREESSVQITEDMLCGYTAGQDSCQGDSGGPFTIQVGQEYYQQADFEKTIFL